MYRVCLTHSMSAEFHQTVRALGDDIEIIVLEADGSLPADQSTAADSDLPIDAFLASYDITLLANRDSELADRVLPVVRKAKFVQTGVAGLDEPFLRAAHQQAQRYCNGSGVHAVPIANYVLLQMLRHCKRLDEHAQQQQANQWQPMWTDGELTDKTVLIYGYGGIGQEVGRLCQAFRMQVIGVRRSEFADANADMMITPEAVPSHLANADYVVLCLPGDDNSTYVADSQFLQEMKSSAALINVGRGSLVDTAALHQALTDGDIAFAALDVIENEPLSSDSPYWNMPNCHISAHDSPYSPFSLTRLEELFIDNLKRHRHDSSAPLRNEIISRH